MSEQGESQVIMVDDNPMQGLAPLGVCNLNNISFEQITTVVEAHVKLAEILKNFTGRMILLMDSGLDEEKRSKDTIYVVDGVMILNMFQDLLFQHIANILVVGIGEYQNMHAQFDAISKPDLYNRLEIIEIEKSSLVPFLNDAGKKFLNGGEKPTE